MIRKLDGGVSQPQAPVADTPKDTTATKSGEPAAQAQTTALAGLTPEQARDRKAEHTLTGSLIANQLQKKVGENSTTGAASGLPSPGEGATLASTPSTARHPIQDRISGLKKAHAAEPSYLKDMDKLTNDPKFQALPSKEQQKLLTVFDNTTPKGRENLQGLLNKNIDGKPALLSKGIKDDSTLLDHLDRLSSSDMDKRLAVKADGPPVTYIPVDKEKVVEELTGEVLDPDATINQHSRGTCTTTSMSHKLAQQRPAEYARLVTDLATKGESKLANGDKITVPGDDSWQPDGSNRSNGERLLQSSLMAYGRPDEKYYNWDPGKDGKRGTADDGHPDPTNFNKRSLDGFKDSDGGLSAKQSVRVMDGLYGKSHDNYNGSNLLKDDGIEMRQRVEREIKEGRSPVMVGVKWGGGLHMVEVLKVTDDGRIHFRNPVGGGNIGATGTVNGSANNQAGTGPLRTVEDGRTGVESMSLRDFQELVNNVYVPE